jgi:Universal stress protein family
VGEDVLTMPTAGKDGPSEVPESETESGGAWSGPVGAQAHARPGARGVVARLAANSAVGTAATRAARGISAKLGYEEIVFPEDSSASAIGRIADSRDRVVIVCPASDVGESSRAAYADRVCRIAAATRHPVLLIPASSVWPFRRCVTATDFGRPSLAAARAVMDLVDAPAELVLAFVNASDDTVRSTPDGVPRHVRLLLDALSHTLGAPAGVEVASVVLTGRVLPSLLAYARDCSADLLSFGRHGRSTSAGLLGAPLGPTVRGLLEGLGCPALIASAG